MTGLPFPLSEATLLVGPSNVGKTRLTARALDAWVEQEGPEGVVVLDFAPVIERDGHVLGGRLGRFTTIPDAVWTGVLAAHAPRAESDSEEEAVALARDNAERAGRLLDAAPERPRAVFVNDATITRQHDPDAPHRVIDYCDRVADVAVLNAFESTKLGDGDSVSQVERESLASLQHWAARTVSLA